MYTAGYSASLFFLLTFLISWGFGFFVAYFSWHQQGQSLAKIFFFPALLGPLMAFFALVIASPGSGLFTDFLARWIPGRVHNSVWIVLAAIPLSLLVATQLSVWMGHSPEQYKLAPQWAVWKGETLFGLLLFLLAPLVEEIGWRGYGVDSLRQSFNLFNTSILFALLWGLWHLPLFFVKGYYQNQLLDLGALYVINFFFSTFPITFLMNWVYYTNRRNISWMVLLHFVANISFSLLQTAPFTKCIATGVMAVIAAVVVALQSTLFF